MARTRKEKTAMLDSYKGLISKSKGMIVLKTSGITPNEANALKKELFDVDSEYHVIKNNIFKIALSESNLGAVESLDLGSHSVLFFSEDIVSPSKFLKKFIEDVNVDGKLKVELAGGFLDGNSLNIQQLKDLADMPSKEQSIAMVLGILDQAIGGVINVLQNPVQSYASILDQAFEK